MMHIKRGLKLVFMLLSPHKYLEKLTPQDIIKVFGRKAKQAGKFSISLLGKPKKSFFL